MPFLGGRGQASRGYFGGGTTPDAPTGLSSTPGDQQLFIAFTAPAFNGGLDITNYEYAISSNSGSTYSAWTALSPADTTSPVTVPGLVNGTAYYVKLRAVNSLGAGVESSPVTSNTTPYGNPTATTGSGSDATTTPSAPTTNAPTNTQSFGTANTQTYTSGSGTWTNPYPSGASTGTGTLNGSSGTTSFLWGTSSGSYPNEVTATSNAYVRTTWPRGTTVYYKAKITNTSCAVGFAGTVNANGSSTTVTFEYGVASGVYTSSVSGGTVTGVSNTSVSGSVSGLSAGTIYFRVKAVNARGTTYGSEQSVAISSKTAIASNEQSFTPPALTTIYNILVVGGGGPAVGGGGGGGGVSASNDRPAPSSLSYSVGAGRGYTGVVGQSPGDTSSLSGGSISMSATGGTEGAAVGSSRAGTAGSGSGGTTFNSSANIGGLGGASNDVDYAAGGGGGAGGAGGDMYVGPPTYNAQGGPGGAAVTYYGITVGRGGGGQDFYNEPPQNGSTPASSYGGGGYSDYPYTGNGGGQGGLVRFVWYGP